MRLELPCRKLRQCSRQSTYRDRRSDVLHGEIIRRGGTRGAGRKWERNLNTKMHFAFRAESLLKFCASES